MLRQDTSGEGGELSFQRASDAAIHYYLDVIGTGTTPSFRLVNAVRGVQSWVIDNSGNMTAEGNITANGQFHGNGAGLTNVPASAIAGALNASGSAPIYACRAWVNFQGTGTVAIRASGNVSSITDNGVGNYTVNFTNAMPDANYATNITPGIDSIAHDALSPVVDILSTSGVRFRLAKGLSSGLDDSAIVCISIFR